MVPKNPFAVEEYRHSLAVKNNKKQFKSTYTKTYPHITDKNTARSWEKQLHDSPDVIDPITKDRIDTTTKLVYPLNEKTSILDIGIGNAWVEKKLIQKYGKEKFHITGVDITKKNLSKVHKETGADIHIGDILKMPRKLAKEKYDYILLLEVLEHIPFVSTFKALKNIHSRLKKDGFFIISVPVYEDLEVKIAEGRNYSHHVRRYTPDIIKMELQLAGFTVIEEKWLYAFGTFHRLKSLISRLTGIRKPNVVVLKCKKNTSRG